MPGHHVCDHSCFRGRDGIHHATGQRQQHDGPPRRGVLHSKIIHGTHAGQYECAAPQDECGFGGGGVGFGLQQMKGHVTQTKHAQGGDQQKKIFVVLCRDASTQVDPIAGHHAGVHFKGSDGGKIHPPGEKRQEVGERWVHGGAIVAQAKIGLCVGLVGGGGRTTEVDGGMVTERMSEIL